jgi:hypothetical protein
MNARDALNKVFEVFPLKAKDIALSAGVLETQLSRFRKGKTDLRAETLFAIVNALPPAPRAFWFALVMQKED